MFRHLLALALLLPVAPPLRGDVLPAADRDAARLRCQQLNDTGSFAEALPFCRAAADAQRAAAEPGREDDGALGRALTSLGLALEMTGDRQAAEASYREALALHRARGHHDLEALVLSNLAALSIDGGDYGAALAWLAEEEAVANHALEGGEQTWAAAELDYVRINRSVALEQLGAYEEALAEIRPLAGRTPDKGDTHQGTAESASLAVNLAVLYRNLGDPRRALALLERAGAVYERLRDRSALANIHLNRALVFQLNLRAPERAEEELAQALELARAGGDRSEEIRSLCALGDLQRARGRLDEARSAFEQALTTARDSDAAAGRWTARAGLGRVARDEGDAATALFHLRAAISEIESAGAGLGSAALRGELLADQRAVYAAAIDLLAEQALAVSGNSGDNSGANSADNSAGISARSDRPSELADAASAAGAALALAEKARARELLDALGGGGGEAPLVEGELAAFARRAGPTLVYFFGESQLWRFESAREGWRVARAGSPTEISAAVTRVHRQLAQSETPSAEDLAMLGHRLLPAAIAPGDELRIVPDGRLFYLPFELLPDPQRPGSNLLERRAVSYLPSLSVLAHLHPPVGDAPWRLAALADPELEPRTSPGAANSLASLLGRRYALPPLPGAAREARSAAARLGQPSSVEVGTEATESALRQRAAQGALVLHIAAHTVVDESLTGGVALFLAPDRQGAGAANETNEAHDGLVTAEELAHLPLVTELAVLSGCRTALAEPGMSGNDGAAAGRALASLSGALLGAGARGVVASLWEVGDAATAALMEQFYFELARGRRPAVALRLAKLRLAHDPRWSAASGWAGFVLLGDPGRLGRTQEPWTVLAGALAAIFAGALLLRRRRRQNAALSAA